MRDLPSDVVVYKTTPIFNQDTIPKALLKDHNTKKGTWGRIKVLKGKLLYTINAEPPEKILLTQEVFGVVEPEVLHYVTPDGQVEFFVEFLK